MSTTGMIVLQRLAVQVEQVLFDQQSVLQKVQSGEVAALVRVVGKPVDFFTRIPPTSGLHLVPIPFTRGSSGPPGWAEAIARTPGLNGYEPAFAFANAD